MSASGPDIGAMHRPLAHPVGALLRRALSSHSLHRTLRIPSESSMPITRQTPVHQPRLHRRCASTGRQPGHSSSGGAAAGRRKSFLIPAAAVKSAVDRLLLDGAAPDRAAKVLASLRQRDHFARLPQLAAAVGALPPPAGPSAPPAPSRTARKKGALQKDARRLKGAAAEAVAAGQAGAGVVFQLLAACARADAAGVEGAAELAERVYRFVVGASGRPDPTAWGIIDAGSDGGGGARGAERDGVELEELVFAGAMRVAQARRNVDMAVSILGDAFRCNLWPTVFLMNDAMKVCIDAGDTQKAVTLYSTLPDLALKPHVSTQKLLVRAFSRVGGTGEALSHTRSSGDKGGGLRVLRQLMAESQALCTPTVYEAILRHAVAGNDWDMFKSVVQEMLSKALLDRAMLEQCMSALRDAAATSSGAGRQGLVDTSVWLLESAGRITALATGAKGVVDLGLTHSDVGDDKEGSRNPSRRDRIKRRGLGIREEVVTKPLLTPAELAKFVRDQEKAAKGGAGAVGAGLLSPKLCSLYVECVLASEMPVRAKLVEHVLDEAGVALYKELSPALLRAMVLAGLPGDKILAFARAWEVPPDASCAYTFCRAVLDDWLAHRRVGKPASVSTPSPFVLLVELTGMSREHFVDPEVYSACLRLSAQGSDANSAQAIMHHIWSSGLEPTFKDYLYEFAATVRANDERSAEAAYAKLKKRAAKLVKNRGGGGAGGSARAAASAAVVSSLARNKLEPLCKAQTLFDATLTIGDVAPSMQRTVKALRLVISADQIQETK